MKRALTVAVAVVLGCAAEPRVVGQTRAGLDIQVYAGLTITGAVGAVYSVEYVTDLAQTNTPSAWRCLEFLQLPASPYLLVDRSVPTTGKRFYRAAVMEAPTNMVFVPPGTFRMGSPTNESPRAPNEGPQTAVTISRGFWMGGYEVTQGEYLAVTGSNPSWFDGVRPYGIDIIDYGTDLNRPVENVTWDDATQYCVKLTERERAMGRIAVNVVYRLPSEAEWEYACRAGTSTRFSYGDDPGYTNLANYAWYSGNAEDGFATQPVGKKLPNAWGVYDMHGNVWEWCQDWQSDHLAGGMVIDPQGGEVGTFHVFRGGSWGAWHPSLFLLPPAVCRATTRSSVSIDITEHYIGFRVVLAPHQP